MPSDFGIYESSHKNWIFIILYNLKIFILNVNFSIFIEFRDN
jgi:hypothetical protein